ncbi:MAG: cobalamin transport system permease protein [Actinomycetota bacterium]|nr:cobalamin transport system permease protein [Actinomycetota bacterium]
MRAPAVLRRPRPTGRPRATAPRTAGRPRTALRFVLALAALGAVVVAGIALGAVRIPLDVVWRALLGQEVQPPYDVIVHDIRLPRTITATLVGASLGLAGLQMQTLFGNPLADPFILGVSSGASLGVALVVLAVGSSGWSGSFASGLGGGGDVGIAVAAATGAATVMGLVLLVGRCVTSSTTLLLLGVMFSYLVSALVTVLLAGATPELVHQYIQWNFGSYRGVTWSNLHVLVPVLVCGLLACLLLPKRLNALLLGERYATTMGVDVPVTRTMIIVVTAVLAGTATAFCGPVQFLGIAVPHLCRALFSTSDHRVLLPACAVLGAALALGADVLAQLPGDEVLPLNAVNAAIGAPVVIYVLMRRSPSGVPA